MKLRACSTSSWIAIETIGAMSKSSSERPPRAAPSSSERPEHVDVLGREDRREPAVGDLGGERRVLRPDRGDVDRDPLLHRA